MTRSVLTVLLAILVLHGSARASSITTCGTTIAAGDVGTLAADLNCTDPNTPAVTLAHKATLELAGHSIQGISSEPQQSHDVVLCADRKCTIVGPGSIAGNDGASSYGDCIGGPFDGTLTMTSNGQGEITVQNCSTGIIGRSGKLTDVHTNGDVVGISLYKSIVLHDVDVSNNEFGIIGRKISGGDVTANGNSKFGIVGNASKGTVHLKNLTATANGGAGVIAYGITIQDGTVTGNAGYGQGLDIVSVKRPHLKDVTCGLSGKIGESYTNGPPALVPGSWGVCSGD